MKRRMRDLFTTVLVAGLLYSGCLTVEPADAQWQVPLNTIPIGRGPGVTGFNSIVNSGTGTLCLVNSAPPAFNACPLSGGLVVGSTTITGGTSNGLLYNNAGVIGNLATANNGVLATNGSGVPSIVATLPSGSGGTGISNSGTITVGGNLSTSAALAITAGSAAQVATWTSGTAITGTNIASLLTAGTGIAVTGTTNATIGFAAQAANTVFANVTAGSAVPVAMTFPSCTGASSAYQYTNGVGLSCGVITSATTVGTTTISSGTSNGLLFNNAGVLGNTAAVANAVLITNGSSVPSLTTTLPSGITAPALTVTGSFTATGLVANAALVNSTMTINGTTCTLGASCSPSSTATSITPGVTTVLSGTSNGILYNSAGLLGNTAAVANAVLSTNGSSVPSLSTTLPSGLTAPALTVTNSLTSTGLTSITTAVGTLNFDFKTTGAVGGTASQTATQGKIFGGSSGTPLTTPVPMIAISRYEAFSGTDTQGAQNPALLIELFSNNTSNEPTINAQGTGLKVEATQIATGRGDIVAGFFYATQSGLVGTATGHASYGIFAQANVTVNNNNAFGGEIIVSNNTGTDYSYNGTYPFAAALHVGATGSNRANIGVWFQGSKTFDVGVVFDSTSITTASIQDDSSAVTSIKIKGSHTTGLDTSSGTFSGNQINATGFTVSNSGATTSRYIGGGSSPTVGTCTGLGTGGSPGCAMGANSTDNAGQFILTTGTTSPGSNGSATLTFSGAIGPHSSVCTFTPSSGSAAWSNPSTTAGSISTTAFVLDWENGNGATALTASKTYVINYICFGY